MLVAISKTSSAFLTVFGLDKKFRREYKPYIMKKLSFAILLTFAAIIASAQSYTVKIYQDYGHPLERISEDLNLPILQRIKIPQSISKENFDAFLKSSPTVFTVQALKAKQAKTSYAYTEYGSGKPVSVEDENELLVRPAESKDSVALRLKISSRTKLILSDKTCSVDEYSQETSQTVKLGVPTLVLCREIIQTVNDRVPVLGDLPLIGWLWQTKGESRSLTSTIVLITENKDSE